MKLRVKFNGQSRPIDLGDNNASTVTLRELKELVSNAFLLEKGTVEVSLNKTDVLSGDDAVLSDLGVVAGDLIHVVSPSVPQDVSGNGRAQQRPQPIASHNYKCEIALMNKNQHAQPNEDRPSNATHTTSVLPGNQSDSGPSTSASSRPILDSDQMVTEDTNLQNVNRYMREPLVIGESTQSDVPALLNELYSGTEIKSANDALFVVLHSLMIESGFSLSGTTDLYSMPSDWQRSGFYMCVYEYDLAPNVVAACNLVAVTTGSSMAVHGFSKTFGDFKTDHLQVNSAFYVRDFSQGNAATAYRSLDRLSNLFKDAICLILQNHLATSAGFREPQGLLSLPCEVRMRLMCFLDAKSVCNLGLTCRQFKTIYKDNTVWRRLYMQRFNAPADIRLSRDWYEIFKSKYVELKEEQERRRRWFSMDEDFDHPLHRYGPFAPTRPFPGFLGGEHDLHPHFASGIPDLMNGNRGPMGPTGLRSLPTLSDPFRSGGGRIGRGGRGSLTGSPFSRLNGPFM